MTDSHKEIPRYIEPRKFAQQGVDLVGKAPSQALSRLCGVTESVSTVSVDLQFEIDPEGHKVLTGQVSAETQVICQRCLSPMPLHLQAQVNVAVVWDEDGANRLPKHLDPWIVTDTSGDLYELLEEELLLVLPMAAYHEVDCVAKDYFSSGEAVEESPASETNPFSVLQKLKGSPNS